jgi:penicillin-binding protein 1B
MMIRRYLLLALTAVLLLHSGYLYYKVVAAGSWEAPSILYGRPTEIRKGDPVGDLRLTERLQRLSYRKIKESPTTAGTYSEEHEKIRIFLRDNAITSTFKKGPVDLSVRDGRVVSLVSPTGAELDSVQLEPEEIGRIMGPKMESRRPVPLSAISPFFQNAVIASEDARFYSHIGIDILAVGRAFVTNLRKQQFVQGGSTITQQLAKNLFLSPKKTLWRKLYEAELALFLELRYSKKQILEMYLNKIYFGQEGPRGVYGIEEAAEFYFSKQAKDISLEESALLAGIIRSPNRYSLLKDTKAAKGRRNEVLRRMHQLEMIGENEFRRASNASVRIRPRSATASSPASYFVDYLQRMTAAELGDEKLYRTGYRYYTTLDPIHQTAAQEAVTRGLKEIEKTALPAGEPLQAALVAVDPRTGAMTAMVGGRDYGETQFNRAADAKRQPGSAFKPFVLLSALSLSTKGKGDKTLSTMVSGEPVSIPTPEGIWSPSNVGGKVYGKITIRKAIEESVNTAVVRLANDVGLTEVFETARAAGITSPLSPVPSMALGTFEVTPMELAYAYTTIASGGIRFGPFPLFSVTTADGDILMEKEAQRKSVFDARAAYLTGYAMEGVLERGTASSAKSLGIYFQASGKTGTTDDNRDSWFIGYTPDVVCAVWVGYDSGARTGLTGARGALHIWARFLRALYPQTGPMVQTPPEGVETAVIDPESGFLATTSCPQTLREAYLTGTAPKETCPQHPVHPVVDTLRKGARTIRDFFRNLFKK